VLVGFRFVQPKQYIFYRNLIDSIEKGLTR
jgi:hypothetical protein